MSFIITGMPRSGTMFIQKNMNKSNKFNVTHDNKDIIDLVHRFYLNKNKDLLKNINKKLSGKNRGFVSGVFRHEDIVTLPNVDKVGVIIRNPVDVFKSRFIKSRGKNLKNMLDDWSGELRTIDNICSMENTLTIRFDEMVKNKEYLLNTVFSYFGIDDVPLDKIDLGKQHKTNLNGGIFWKNSDTHFMEKVKEESLWFIDKHNL